MRRARLTGPFIHCLLCYLVQPIEDLGLPLVSADGPDERHPWRNLFAVQT
jgi:hypothetical protein